MTYLHVDAPPSCLPSRVFAACTKPLPCSVCIFDLTIFVYIHVRVCVRAYSDLQVTHSRRKNPQVCRLSSLSRNAHEDTTESRDAWSEQHITFIGIKTKKGAETTKKRVQKPNQLQWVGGPTIGFQQVFSKVKFPNSNQNTCMHFDSLLLEGNHMHAWMQWCVSRSCSRTHRYTACACTEHIHVHKCTHAHPCQCT